MMNEQSNPGNPSAPVMLPAKRRRGRPRKDGGVPKRGSSLTPTTPAPEMVKKTQVVEVNNQIDGTVENMVGRMVSGVIDGCFDAGYFLTVRVGNSNTLLRGVVFQPGRFAPISASNDVAPQAKMYQRRDIPLPVPNLQGQNDGMIPQSDKLVKQPVQLGPPQAGMDLPSKPTSSDTFVLNNNNNNQMNQQPPSVMVPQSGPFSIQMNNNMSRSGSGFPFGGKIMVHQNPDQRLQIQSQSGHRPENLGLVEHDEVMQVFELSTQSEMPPKVGSEADKTDILPSEGTSNQIPQTPLGSMAQQCFMSYNMDQSNPRIPQNPAAATVSQTVDSESQDVESEMEKSQFDSGEVRHPNHEQNETPQNPVQEKPPAIESGQFVHSESVELHQTPVVAELQFISQEPEAAESELKPSDTNNLNNELKSPVHTIEKLGTTQQTPQALEVEHAGQCHHNPGVGNTQTVHPELINDPMDFMMEKPTSPKNNPTQHSPEGKPISDPGENAMRGGSEFSLESTGQILTLGIGGSDNPGRFDTQFYNQVSGSTDFGFVLGDFAPPTGSHGNPNNMPETQHR